MTILEFGKYKDKEISEIFNENPNYCVWLLNQPMIKNYPEIYEYLKNNLLDKDAYYMSFGKYKNKSLDWIKINDPKYIEYLKNNEFVISKLDKLYELVKKL